MSSSQTKEKTFEEIEKEASQYPIFTFADILRALREHPEWLQELRKMILTEELLELPRKFDELLRRVVNIEKDLEILKQDVAMLKQDVAMLKQDVAMLKQEMAMLKQDMAYLKGEFGRFKGKEFERTIRERYFAYFGRVLRRSRRIEMESLLPVIDELEEKGVIDEKQRESVLHVDLIVEGTMKRTEKRVALAVEVSYSVHEDDLVRAQERAGILALVLGKEVIPTIVGVDVGEEIERKADEKGVLLIKVDY